jgi:hypothetical protein
VFPSVCIQFLRSVSFLKLGARPEPAASDASKIANDVRIVSLISIYFYTWGSELCNNRHVLVFIYVCRFFSIMSLNRY